MCCTTGKSFTVTEAKRRYRTAPPGYKVARRRAWVLAVARTLAKRAAVSVQLDLPLRIVVAG